MKVLHVLGNLGYGGIETFIMNIYRHVDREKIRFDFLIRDSDNGEKVNEIRAMGGKVIFSPLFPKKPVSNYFFTQKFFREHASEYDAVHIHCNSLIYPLPIILAHKYGIKTIILHSHNTCNHGRLVTAYHRHNINRYDKYLSYRFACGEDAGKWMFEDRPFQVIHNGIDLDVFKIDNSNRNKYRNKLGFSADDKVIGHVGRFSEQKNHRFIIDLFAELEKENNQYKLLLLGDGELKNDIENYAKEKYVFDNIVFTGNVNNVQDYMQAMDLFILPSLYEGLPVVAVEAQACGLPAIFSTGVSEKSKFTDNVNFISTDNMQMWISGIREMITAPKEENSDKIKSAGYDVLQTSDLLMRAYSEPKLEMKK